MGARFAGLLGLLICALVALPAAAAAAAPSIVSQSVGSVDQNSARLYAFVNPGGQNTNYFFEYGTSSSYGKQAPEFELFAGNGSEPVKGSASLSGLQENTTYHYRAVASNPSGTIQGADQTFTTGVDPASCPNASIRAAQVSEALPSGTTGLIDCLALEMASAPVKGQKPANVASISSDGEHVLYRTAAALSETEAVLNLAGDFYVAERGGDGWTTTPTLLHRLFNLGNLHALSADFTRWFQIFPETSLQQSEGVSQAYLSSIDRNSTPISPLLDPIDTDGAIDNLSLPEGFEGASADFSHLYLQPPGQGQGASPSRYSADDPIPGGATARSNVYVAAFDGNGDPAPLQLLARDSLGKVWGARCGARIGGDANLASSARLPTQRIRKQGSISEDGSRVYFSTRPTQEGTGTCATANKMRILERLETPSGPQIAELIANECTRVAPACDLTNGDDNFQGASADGTKVYFTTTRQLANSDLDTGTSCGTAIGASVGCDLYLYDSTLPAGQRLIQVSAGEASNPTPGSGANVLNSIAAISTDGSHAYFVAQGVLTTVPNRLGTVAQAGQRNLYAYQRNAANPNGKLVFIGTVGSADEGFLWGASQTFQNGAFPVPAETPGGGSGQVLLFVTTAQLSANDADGARRDAYRYDSAGGSLQCVSCLPGGGSGPFDILLSVAGNGSPPPGPDMTSRNRWTSEDGSSVVFSTAEALLPSDTNGIFDDYLWRDGQLQQLPRSSGYAGSVGDAPTISADGSTVAFLTPAALLPGDGDTVGDAYIVRSGGGYPIPLPSIKCAGEECQAPFAALPGEQAPSSESQSGENVREALPRRCRKGFVRNKAGKCVKRHRKSVKRHKGKRHQNRAGHERQGGSK